MRRGFLNQGSDTDRKRPASAEAPSPPAATRPYAALTQAHPKVTAFFHSLSDTQRTALASIARDLSREELAGVGAQLAEAGAEHADVIPDALRLLEEAGGTGPAFVAFGTRAVDFRYMTREQLERVATRLVATPEPQREGAVVAAMRRFLAFTQPLGGEVTLVNCPVRHKCHPKLSVNGRTARVDSFAPPGGNPERYNVTVKLPVDDDSDDDDDEPKHNVQAEPKYLRPLPRDQCFRDSNFNKIPDDHEADAWYAERVARWESMQIMMGGRSYGPPRPK